MRSCELTIMAFVLAALGGAGCNADHVLLRSECRRDAGDDCAPPAPKCDEGSTKACDNCPDGFAPLKFTVGACTVCECRPKCEWHDQCEGGMVCVGGICAECSDSDSECNVTCNWGWAPMRVMRNGCALCECTPRNECRADGDCGVGQVCYPGQQCLDGCRDPSCCFGNLCSPAGCMPPTEGECAYVGCPRGGVCRGDPGCPLTGCKCTPGAVEEWSCPNTCFAVCQSR